MAERNVVSRISAAEAENHQIVQDSDGYWGVIMQRGNAPVMLDRWEGPRTYLDPFEMVTPLPKAAPHGTANRYRKEGCRCALCREAKSGENRTRYE